MKKLLSEEFTNCYDTNGWFVSVRKAVEGINLEQAAWKPADSVNCIWESLSHLTFYNHAWLQRFKGLEYKYEVSSNDETFSTGEYDEPSWKAEIAHFDEVMAEWKTLIESSDEAKLNELVPDRDGTTWAEIISLINTHNAYHAGQILVLRKLHGNWDASKGVS